jgi:glycosyltransferase involved in cell wall biosynthesis
MKILQIINSLSTGGAEKLIIDSVPLYQNQGLTVDVLLLNNAETQFKSKLKETSNGRIEGLSIGSVYNPFLIFKIIPYLKKYDIIHLHLFPTLYWVVLAKWISFSNVKLVYTEHSTHNRRRDNLIFKMLDRFIYKKIDCIVTIADEVDSNLKKHLKLNEDKFQQIENGVDVNYYHSAIPYTKDKFFSGNDFILIQVSSFRWQKDQKTLIESLQYLPDNIKLLLVGDGPLIDESKQLAKELKLNERILFLGNREDVPRLLNTSDVVVLSSRHEGLSLSNIEGMSVGKPFVGSNVQGLREVVEGYGLLFEQGDYKELANIITNLYNDSDLYKKVADQCYLRAQEFDIKRMIKRYISLYKSILNN